MTDASDREPGVPAPRGPLLGATALWSACAAFWVWRLQGWTVDDFFISYRYAANLAAGHGLVYNLGERVFGVTDPGLALLLGFLRWLTGWRVEMLASVVFGAALVCFCALILRVEMARGAGLVAFIGGTLLVNSTLLWVNNGAAAALCTLLLTLAALQPPRRALLAGVLAGLAVWVRPDAALALPVLAWLQFRTDRRGAVVSTLAAGLIVLGGLLAAYGYFGRPLPQTLHAKAAMAQHEENLASLSFWPAAAESFRRHLGRPWALAILASVAGLPLLLLAASTSLRLVSAFALLLAIAYPILGVPYFSWYSILEVIAGTYAAVTIVAWLTRWIVQRARLKAPRAVATTTILLSLMLFLPALRRTYAMARDYTPPQRLLTYRDAGLWLRAHSQPYDRVAHTEVGVLGYYSERPIVDLMGLVSPPPKRPTQTLAIPRALRSSEAEFVLHRVGGRSEEFVRRPWFTEAYESVAEFPDPQARSESLVIFRHR